MLAPHTWIAAAVSAVALSAATNAQDEGQTGFEFEAPILMKVGEEPILVEAPGYAAPCWADIDGDGDHDLLVGQFAQGKITVCENDGEGRLVARRWLEADGDVATVPGVW